MYIDFYIKNEQFAYSLPIELDGLWKVENYNDFDDMMLRQNALLDQFKYLLRYTNKQMLSQPNSIIQNITETLEKQKKHQDVTDLVITKSNAQNALYKKQILELKNELKKSQLEKVTPVKSQPDNTKKIQGVTTSTMLKLGISFLIVVIICAFFYKSVSKNQIGTSSNQNISAVSSSVPIKSQEETTEKKVTKHKETHHVENKPKTVHSNQNQQYKDKSTDQSPTALTIESKDAIQNIGSEKIVCGVISQQKTFAKGIYLNMGGRYPNQDITFVIWNDDIYKLPVVQEMIGNTICIYGKILNHRGTPQINLKQSSQIR